MATVTLPQERRPALPGDGQPTTAVSWWHSPGRSRRSWRHCNLANRRQITWTAGDCVYSVKDPYREFVDWANQELCRSTPMGGLPKFRLKPLNDHIAPITVIQRSPASALNRTFRQACLVTEMGGKRPVRL
jgi:hypothetical protein